MDQTLDGPASRAASLLHDLETYWRSLRGARRLPVRTEVDPARIDAVLPHAFVLERVAPEVARFRVAGQTLSGWLGMDPRGMPLSVLFTPEARACLRLRLRQVFDGPALVDLPVVAPRGLARPRLAGRMLLLPMLDTDGRVSRALGALVTDQDGRGRPRRFDLSTTGAERVEPCLAPVQSAPRTTLLAAVAGGRSHQTGPVPSPRPALRLVVSNG